MNKILLYIILACSLVSNTLFIYETSHLKRHIKYIEQENKQLKEMPEMYWQKAIEKFNNKNYIETKKILNELIEKFPTSNLVKNSQDKIKEIDLAEKKKKEEAEKLIKTLPKQIANAKSSFHAEKILTDLDRKYDDSYYKLKKVIKNEREKLQYKIEKERRTNQKEKGINITEQHYCKQAEKIIQAIKENSFEIMNGDTSMYKVVINTIGKPIQTFTGSDYVLSYDILLYEQKVREGNLAYKQFHTVPFIVYIPIIDERQEIILKEAGIMNRNNKYETLFDYQLGSLKICRYGKKYDPKKKKFI